MEKSPEKCIIHSNSTARDVTLTKVSHDMITAAGDSHVCGDNLDKPLTPAVNEMATAEVSKLAGGDGGPLASGDIEDEVDLPFAEDADTQSPSEGLRTDETLSECNDDPGERMICEMTVCDPLYLLGHSV
ncbi:unnamed protein product [Nippostrongylus brasiliensis]|uniref:Uncharacterized protein n=1 Tax=Nippostrongylus brasiliensis TaxID=27835 RepID=A0A0N4YCA0_NIPBR|nr:unnamed protein product [Nippostrongylus brasiliensis]